jgi:hypothetical protein
VSNVLNEEKKKQVIALGQLGWALRRIEKETGVRRETAAGYLKSAGISVRPAGGWGRRKPPPSKPANVVTTGPEAAKPANGSEVTTGSGGAGKPPDPTASTSEPYRELIESALSQGRNAMSIWQELVDRYSFTGAYESVKRYVRKLRGTQSPEARAIIQTVGLAVACTWGPNILRSSLLMTGTPRILRLIIEFPALSTEYEGRHWAPDAVAIVRRNDERWSVPIRRVIERRP